MAFYKVLLHNVYKRSISVTRLSQLTDLVVSSISDEQEIMPEKLQHKANFYEPFQLTKMYICHVLEVILVIWQPQLGLHFLAVHDTVVCFYCPFKSQAAV